VIFVPIDIGVYELYSFILLIYFVSYVVFIFGFKDGENILNYVWPLGTWTLVSLF
jgi:hypothetical protein